jgi:hypothetical protein
MTGSIHTKSIPIAEIKRLHNMGFVLIPLKVYIGTNGRMMAGWH